MSTPRSPTAKSTPKSPLKSTQTPLKSTTPKSSRPTTPKSPKLDDNFSGGVQREVLVDNIADDLSHEAYLESLEKCPVGKDLRKLTPEQIMEALSKCPRLQTLNPATRSASDGETLNRETPNNCFARRRLIDGPSDDLKWSVDMMKCDLEHVKESTKAFHSQMENKFQTISIEGRGMIIGMSVMATFFMLTMWIISMMTHK